MKYFGRLALAGVVVLCGWATASNAPAPAERALPRTHSHNDYTQPRPLLDALANGFTSVEADVFLVGTQLRVAHDRVDDWATVPTLEQFYLKPLSDLMVARKSGGIYPDGTPVLLLVDIKTGPVATYQRLHEVLAEYQSAHPGLFTTYSKAADGSYGVTRGAVNVIVSGNRPREVMAQQRVRYAAYDGRRADIGPDVKPDDVPAFVPLISDNWKDAFKDEPAWDGTGEMPAGLRARLESMVVQVHREGKLLRFWNLPKDTPLVWAALYDAGVDLINTHDLPGLAGYVASRVPKTED